eukprot:368955_1
MALPLNEAQQPYSAMKRQYKWKLPQMFNGNLYMQWIRSNLTFGSFSKQHGGHQSISAAIWFMPSLLSWNRMNKPGPPNNPHNQHTLFDDNIWKANFFYAYVHSQKTS